MLRAFMQGTQIQQKVSAASVVPQYDVVQGTVCR